MRSIFVTVMLLVTALSLLVSIALVVLTTELRAATESVGASVESVRIVEEAEIDLLLHAGARDTVVGHDIEGNLRRKMHAAREYVSSQQERELLESAAASVESYLAASHDPGAEAKEVERRHARAYGALEALATLNVVQARASREAAARGNRIGNALGIGVGGLLVLVFGVVGVWLRRAFRPLFGLAEVMTRFGQGQHDARAHETGPAELREMSRRFNELADAVETQRRSQIAFLGGVAHDLSNPLGALCLSLELLETDITPQNRSAFERAERQLKRIERMVGDFLNLAKIDAGELDLSMQVQDLRVIVSETLADPRLSIRLPAQPILVRCDALRIEQVVTNLVSNALKYSPRATPVEVELAIQSRRAVLRVVDHGVGISDNEQRELFQPFRRVGSSRATTPGTGLGLWVACRIAEAHGGKLVVESASGQGSTFSLHLPLSDAGQEHLEPPTRVPAACESDSTR
ncbi:MAG: HAMP domain-containing histidine kinase [Deltaproteobacteria bacterium]|nr:HAMP domain-containing histidine kinase [Deltaproteobacteria bacterium]